jgi:hypothetical protein
MTHDIQLAALSANAAADAIAARCNSGTIKIYGTAKPATADTATSGQTLLATCTFGATAFAAASGGIANANAITRDTDADATGTAVWFRVLTTGGATVMDGTVGVGPTFDCNVPTTSVVQHAQFSVTSMSITMPLA